MHDALSNRITKLVADADDISPKTLKTELLDLAKQCQVLPNNTFLVRAVCRQISEAVTSVFGSLSMLPVMTEPCRRQVYFAVLAKLEADGALDGEGLSETERAELITRMVVSRNKDLIASVYGTCPSGFLRLVSRFGERGRKPAIYVELFKLLNANPDLAKPLIAATQDQELSDGLIHLAREMPATPLGVKLAARFGTKRDYNRFMRTYRVIAHSENLLDNHMQRLLKGESPCNLVTDIYLSYPFPKPALNIDGINHVTDGYALVRTAREFSNCLGRFVAEALNNERQFYTWQLPGEPKVVFAIDSEAPFGWYLTEYGLANNETLPQTLRFELEGLLTSHGVRVRSSASNMMNTYLENWDEGEVVELFDVAPDFGEVA